MSYQESVAAAAAALRRGEDANWELARLTDETTISEPGARSQPGRVPMAQWCADVRAASGRRFSANTGIRYKRMWREILHLQQVDDLPSWSETYNRVAQPETVERLETLRAEQVTRQSSPETKRRVARELLADPDVTADPDVQERIVDTVKDPEIRQRLARDPNLRDTVNAQRALEYDRRQPPADPDRERAVNDFDRRLDSAVAEMGVSAMRLVGDWQWLVERLRVINEGHGRLPDDVYDALIDVTRQAALELRYYAAMHSLPEPDFQRAEGARP